MGGRSVILVLEIHLENRTLDVEWKSRRWCRFRNDEIGFHWELGRTRPGVVRIRQNRSSSIAPYYEHNVWNDMNQKHVLLEDVFNNKHYLPLEYLQAGRWLQIELDPGATTMMRFANKLVPVGPCSGSSRVLREGRGCRIGFDEWGSARWELRITRTS